jgi:hypothetical protein
VQSARTRRIFTHINVCYVMATMNQFTDSKVQVSTLVLCMHCLIVVDIPYNFQGGSGVLARYIWRLPRAKAVLMGGVNVQALSQLNLDCR